MHSTAHLKYEAINRCNFVCKLQYNEDNVVTKGVHDVKTEDNYSDKRVLCSAPHTCLAN